jgi:virginiamycin B lyase
VRKGAALVAVLLAALAGGAAGAPAPARDAKDSLASARLQEAKAVDDVLHRRLPTALARLRASHRALAAALDTLGAAELPTSTTTTIRRQLLAAVRAKSRAIAALTARPPNTRTAAVAVRAALAAEAEAAALLGDAPGQPSIAELPIPAAVFGAFDMTLDPDGRSVWVSGPDGSRIVLYRSLEPGSTPTVFRLPPGSAPRGIVFGPDKALYIAESGTNIGGNAIGRLLTTTGELKQFFLPAGAGAPWGITVGPDDKIWFTEVSAGKVGRLDPATGTFREFPLPTPNSQPQGIVLGADGALWGTEAGGNRVFRMTADGRATEYRIPTPNSVPVAISPGRFGYLWVSELSGGKLLRVSRLGRMKEFPLPRGARPYGLVSAPDGNVWFADRGRNRIGLVTPAGRVFDYPIATPNAQPTAIVALGLGSFAFTEFVANQVGTLRFPPR